MKQTHPYQSTAKVIEGRKKSLLPTWGRATVAPGSKQTKSEASYLYVNEVFSCQKFKFLDVGNHHPQGRGHRFGDVLKPHVHSSDLSSQSDGSEFPEGTKTMTITTPAAATPSAPLRFQSATTTPVRKLLPLDQHTAIARHQHISNALDTASWHMRHGRTDQALGRILSAARQLKQVVSEKAGTQ